jgi:putative ABC transport system ATP-binding protein
MSKKKKNKVNASKIEKNEVSIPYMAKKSGINVLTIKNLTKIYDDNTNCLAVDNVNLTVEKGEFVSIIGYSGSGKSTLLNLISGVLEPTSGEVLFEGEDINKVKDKRLSAIRNHEIGYILQGNSLMANLTVKENILLPATFCETDMQYDVNEIMLELGIYEIKDKYPSEISGGEAKRCAIARALLLNPKLLLADEPVSDLDPENTQIIMNAFSKHAANGMAIIMVTHNMETTKYSSITYRMSKGKIMVEG